jgi:putative transposase
MIQSPEHHPWSSVHANLGLTFDPLVTPRETFLAMASDPHERSIAYRSWLRAGISDDEVEATRVHLKQGRALGDQVFQAMVEKILGLAASTRP